MESCGNAGISLVVRVLPDAQSYRRLRVSAPADWRGADNCKHVRRSQLHGSVTLAAEDVVQVPQWVDLVRLARLCRIETNGFSGTAELRASPSLRPMIPRGHGPAPHRAWRKVLSDHLGGLEGRNVGPESGFRPSAVCTSALKSSNPLRRSVTLAASQICAPAGWPIMTRESSSSTARSIPASTVAWMHSRCPPVRCTSIAAASVGFAPVGAAACWARRDGSVSAFVAQTDTNRAPSHRLARVKLTRPILPTPPLQHAHMGTAPASSRPQPAARQLPL